MNQRIELANDVSSTVLVLGWKRVYVQRSQNRTGRDVFVATPPSSFTLKANEAPPSTSEFLSVAKDLNGIG